MIKSTNVMQYLSERGHDEDFDPQPTSDFLATDAPAGSAEKIEVLRQRVERGLPLWHDADRCDYNGCSSGCVRPREKSDRDVGMNAISIPYRKRVIGDDC